MKGSAKGRFKPRNPQKYKGKVSNIIYRSNWELKYMMQLDSSSNVLSWSSEEVRIRYISPLDGKFHTYFPDFVVEWLNKQTTIIELKPFWQTNPPSKRNRVSKKYLTEVRNWGVNEAKWKAAADYARVRGWKFIILTEKELGFK